MLFFIRDLLRLVEQELSREIDRRGGPMDAASSDVAAVKAIVHNALAQLGRAQV
jgi:hypothetical protein